MDLKTRTTDYLPEDMSWLGSQHATDTGKPIELDLSTFDFDAVFTDGYIPAGVVLGEITATGQFGPYGASPNEVQTLTRTSTGGTIGLIFDGEATADDAVPATAAGFTAAAVQDALEALSNINPGDVTVTGDAGGPLTVTFGGQYLGVDVPELEVDDTNATGGTIAADTATEGGGAVNDGRETAAGHLLKPVKVAADNHDGIALASLFWHGSVVEANLPTNHGLDEAAKADLALISYE